MRSERRRRRGRSSCARPRCKTRRRILLGAPRAEEELVQAKRSLESPHRGSSSCACHDARHVRVDEASSILVTDGGGKVTDFNAGSSRCGASPRRRWNRRTTEHVLGIVSRSLAAPEQFVERVETIYASSTARRTTFSSSLDRPSVERRRACRSSTAATSAGSGIFARSRNASAPRKRLRTRRACSSCCNQTGKRSPRSSICRRWCKR